MRRRDRSARAAVQGMVSLAMCTLFSSTLGCSRRESPRVLSSSTAPVASASPSSCPVRLKDVTFEACNLDEASPPLCFYLFVLVRPRAELGACVPGRVKLAILGSARYQTDEIVASTSLVSGDTRSSVVELRLESMSGSQGFFKGLPGALVGKIHTGPAGAGHFELGPGLLSSTLNVRNAAVSDVSY